MEAELMTQILAGGSLSTLAAVLLAWYRCEKNHKVTRAQEAENSAMLRRIVEASVGTPPRDEHGRFVSRVGGLG